MRNLVIVLVALSLFVACEAPLDQQNQDVITYRGVTVETGEAPFLVQNSLAKDDKGGVVISETSADEAVYGSTAADEIYLAAGGENLVGGTWIGSLGAEPVEVSVGASVEIVFASMTEVTLIQAENITYIDESGQSVVFSGSAVITMSALSTPSDGSVTLITTVEYAIGNEGVDPQ